MRIFETPIDPRELPAAAGSYVLELDLRESLTLSPGRLGTFRLGPGCVRYYGSARGPGGLRARVGRHLRPADRRSARPRHWHVDALTVLVPVSRVMIAFEESECELLRRDLESGRFEVAAAGFGSSDCRSCPAHLLIERLEG